MKTSILSILLVSLGLTLAKPTTLLGLPTLNYATLISGGAPVGADGRVIDTPEVNAAKAEHAAAQLNERVNLANEAVKSGEIDLSDILVSQSGNQLARILNAQDLAGASLTLASLVPDTPASAPVGADGRVVDTPAVARAKAEHAAAHLNEKLNQANEAVRNAGLIAIAGSPAVSLRL